MHGRVSALSLQKSSKEEVQTYPSGSEFYISD